MRAPAHQFHDIRRRMYGLHVFLAAMGLLTAMGCTTSSGAAGGAAPDLTPAPAQEASPPATPAATAAAAGLAAGSTQVADPVVTDRVAAGSVVAERAVGPGPFTEILPGTTVGLEMVPVALPGHAPLFVSRTEMTWDAYDVFVFGLDEGAADVAPGVDAVLRPSKPYVLADYGFGHAGYPVICVSAAGAEAFCAWLSARTGRAYRLPTEAEWEALCQAASGAWTDAASTDARLERAWLKENSVRKSHAVGTRAADALGLHDLLGNVGEWCRTADGVHAVRGGSWKDAAAVADCAARRLPVPAWNASDPQLPKSRWWLADANFVGFRVVCDDAR